MTAEDRYWANVARGEPTACWPWTGALVDGYGRFYADGRNVRASRWGYRRFVGPIPQGHDVLHTCDFPACHNPTHWFTGTNADNMADRNMKGRQARGERHGKAKLSWSDVVAIRSDSRPLAAIAADYGVGVSQVHRIRTGTAWVQR